MDANERLHTEWLGMAQPDLVVTTSALKAAEANITWPFTELQAPSAPASSPRARRATDALTRVFRARSALR